MSSTYNKVTIEAGVSGWVLSIPGKPKEIFVRWESVVKRLESLLTSKGYTIQELTDD